MFYWKQNSEESQDMPQSPSSVLRRHQKKVITSFITKQIVVPSGESFVALVYCSIICMLYLTNVCNDPKDTCQFKKLDM